MIDPYDTDASPDVSRHPDMGGSSTQRQQQRTARFGTMDCTKFRALCTELRIRKFPEIAYFDHTYNNKGDLYTQGQNVYTGSMKSFREIRAFSLRMTRPALHEFDPEAIETHVHHTHSLWMVSFTAGGWCGPCTQLRPVFAAAADELRGIVKSAVVDCDAWASFCNRNGISAYPLIRYYGPIRARDGDAAPPPAVSSGMLGTSGGGVVCAYWACS